MGPRLGFLLAVVLALAATRAGGFSLLGPYTDWMQQTNGYRFSLDIGGPMNIGEGYRWNVPVVTYAFDQTFLDYFGSNGVAAVESAIQVLNDLPAASSIVLTNYPFDTRRFNYWLGQELGLYDLTAETLHLLLEQMGLASPTRYVFALRLTEPVLPYLSIDLDSWGLAEAISEGVILERNFDPESLAPSQCINGILYDCALTVWHGDEIVELDAGGQAGNWYVTVADGPQQPGALYLGLTWDDVGGLRYLLSSNNVNYELLLPDVQGAGTNAGSYVNGALRPGVEKISFMRQPSDPLSGQALPLTNQFTDTYITNGTAMQQQLERIISQPDFLFCAADTDPGDLSVPIVTRTGTDTWCNNAAINGDPSKAGPGVITPPVKITFPKFGGRVVTEDTFPQSPAYPYVGAWGSFDSSPTDPFVAYPWPGSPDSRELTVRLHLENNGSQVGSYMWRLPVGPGGQAALLTSTNFVDWFSPLVVTNGGGIIEWEHRETSLPQRFFRVVPQ